MDEESNRDDDSPYDICVSRATDAASVDHAKIVRVLRATLEAHQVQRASLSVALVDDPTIAELHCRHMNCEGPTDVLTFDLSDGERDRVDGEIVISIDTARRESDRRRHGLDAEVCLYALHGTLHLLGFDDQSAADARAMHAREDELLTGLGFGPIYAPEADGGGRP